MVVQADVPESLSKLAQLVGRILQRSLSAIDPRAAFHRLVHFRPDGGDALTACGLAQELFFQASLFILGLRDRVFARGPLFHGRQGRSSAGPRAKDEKLGQRVGAKAVGTVDADARNLSRRVQAGQRGGSIVVRVYTAHHVVDDRPHWYQFLDGIDVLVLQAQLPHKRQPGVDHLFAQVAKIKMNDGAVRSICRVALFHFLDEGLGETIARPEFHVAQDRLGRWCA